MTQEQKFLDALKDIFIGAHIEGDSGYINLMKIKARYYEQAVFPQLLKDVDKATKPFVKSFREELFDKLYTFFNRYFSESGSIYFRHTPLHQNIYERVYTDDRDVMLFWKTHMLYYVKTDRLFQSMGVEVGGEKFLFDVTNLKHKRANEKRELTYVFQSRKAEGTLVFSVGYSEKGRKTKVDNLLRVIKDIGVTLEEDLLLRAFRVFEKQSEVDYFINKNAKAFLKEQFDLWLYQYVFSGENAFTEIRLKQLQAFKDVAYHIIDFIAQFEDELVRVWNKPKFVLNSHYIITLDKIAALNPDLLARLLKNKGMSAQLDEWYSLGMLDEKFNLAEILQKDKLFDSMDSKYQFLPLDTRHFKNLELDILAIFDKLDIALDGWLVHSENYQALTTLLPKFQERVKCVHIDPPYNTDSSGFLYINAYQHSSWLSMMENRISLARLYLDSDGSFLTHIDENEYDHLYSIFRSQDYNYLGTAVWDKRNPMMGGKGLAIQHEYIFFASKQNKQFEASNENRQKIFGMAQSIIEKIGAVNEAAREEFRRWILKEEELSGGERAYSYLEDDGRVYRLVAMTWPNPNPPPPQFFIPLIHPKTGKPCPVPSRGWSRSPVKMQELIDKNEIVFGEDETTQPQRKVYLPKNAYSPLSSVIYNGKKGKQELERLGFDFPYAHPVSLYEELIDSALENENDITFDFFAGSGTTAHAVMNLNRIDGGHRKYILFEMGEHFYSVILPRIKKVAFSNKWREGKANGGQGMSQFVKYYDLEQYEDTLRRSRYESTDAPLFQMTDVYSSYVFLRDLKLLDAVSLDKTADRIEIHPETLYEGIDLAETLSCVSGKWIKRITKDTVEFEDGTTASLSNPDWSLVKPLIWW
jgi:adenine-specific DNA-methyltransferase